MAERTPYVQEYYPHPQDAMWNQEIASIMPWLWGDGVDVGCSNRSPMREQIRVDADPWAQADVVAEVNQLPFDDGRFDYLTAIHVLEHIEDQRQCLMEWARVLKTGGIIAIVYPDLEFTGKQKPILPGDPNYPWAIHQHERTHAEFLKCFAEANIPNLKMLSTGAACPKWSFHVVLQKIDA